MRSRCGGGCPISFPWLRVQYEVLVEHAGAQGSGHGFRLSQPRSLVLCLFRCSNTWKNSVLFASALHALVKLAISRLADSSPARCFPVP